MSDVLQVGYVSGLGTCASLSYAAGSFSPMVLSGLFSFVIVLATVSQMLYRHANHLPLSGLIWPETGFASTGCAAMAPARLSSPGHSTPRDVSRGDPGLAHSSRSKKVLRLPSSASLRPENPGASPVVPGPPIAIEAAVVAGSNSQGETSWLTSVPSRSPATSSWVRS